MMHRLSLLWERLTLYLPTLLMAALALGSWWLVRGTPVLPLPGVTALPRHEPDYVMRQFALRNYDASGRLKSEVQGAEARHFPDTDTLEIDRVLIRSFDEAGRATVATAGRALTRGDATELELFQDARVVREQFADQHGQVHARLEFRGESLHAFIKTERVTSTQAVQLSHGRNAFSADAMDMDRLLGVLILSGRVRGTLYPETSKN